MKVNITLAMVLNQIGLIICLVAGPGGAPTQLNMVPPPKDPDTTCMYLPPSHYDWGC